MDLFDSHCHLTDRAFAEDREAAVLRAAEAGVRRLVSIASTPDDTEAGVALAGAHPGGIWTTAGVHPHEAGGASAEGLARVRDLLERPEVVAVGECGLDYHYDHAPRDAQRRVFGRQIELAQATGMPLVIHTRAADEDMIAFVRDLPPGVRGVLHCFTASDALLEAGLEAGLHASFTGIVTFGSYRADHQIRAVPRDRLMIETDSPYLAPVPHRGGRNEPAFVGRVAEAVARARDETVDEVAASTFENANRFYGLG